MPIHPSIDLDAPRKPTCRYLRRNNERCTAEAVDEHADVVLCSKHLAATLVFLREAGALRL